MSFWQRLFGERAALSRGDAAIVGAEFADAVADSHIAHQEAARQSATLQQRIDRLELVLEGLVCELEDTGTVDVPALRDRIRALDLLDGDADNRLGDETPRRLQPDPSPP
ncbi:MAG: hypothetical protein AAFV53_11320 [Myxococcota bacterium]